MKTHYVWIIFAAVLVLPLGSMAASNATTRRLLDPSLRGIMTTPIGTVSSTGKIRNDKVLVPIQEKMDPRRIQVAVRDGGRLRVTTNNIERTATETNIALEAGKLSFVKFSERSGQNLSTNKVYLDGVAMLPLSAGRVLSARMFMLLSKNAMRWDPKSSVYTNTLMVGIDADGPEILERIKTQMVALAQADVDLDSELVQIDLSGGNGIRRIGVWLGSYKAMGSVTAISEFGEARISIPVERFGLGGMIGLILPGPLLFAAVIGGAIGGLLRAAQKKFKRLPWLVCEGILVGIVVVAALSAGFQLGNVGSSMVAKAVGVFAVAALSGFVGAVLLDKLAKQFSPGKDS